MSPAYRRAAFTAYRLGLSITMHQPIEAHKSPTSPDSQTTAPHQPPAPQPTYTPAQRAAITAAFTPQRQAGFEDDEHFGEDNAKELLEITLANLSSHPTKSKLHPHTIRHPSPVANWLHRGFQQTRRPQKYVENAYDHTEAKVLDELRKNIQKSGHKAFIIKQESGEPPIWPQWVIVTVDLKNSDPRLIREGQYRVLNWRPKDDDALKRLRQNCRYIPDIVNPRTQRRLKVRLEKANATIKRAPQGFEWVQKDINLRKQGLVGPVKFMKQHQISQVVWRAFTT
jgi:hypothetical protein